MKHILVFVLSLFKGLAIVRLTYPITFRARWPWIPRESNGS